MIKIVHFIHALNMGGAETIVRNYALLLDKEKFDVTVLCLDHDDSPYEKNLVEAGVNVIFIRDTLKWGRKKGFIFRVINHFLLFKKISEQLRILKPDILHIHLNLNKYVKSASLPKSVKIFYTHHYNVERWRKEYPNDIKALTWIIKSYQTQLIALNKEMQIELNNLFNIDNTKIINNGINLDLFNNNYNRNNKRAELGIPNNAFLIVHVGRFATIKNHDFLIDVFSEIKKKKENAFLLMIGRGSTEKLVMNKLEFLGLSQAAMILHDRTDVAEILKSADASIFPSFSEGLGIAVIEMQAAGLPCIASKGVPIDTKICNKIKYLSLDETSKKWATELLSLVNSKEKINYYNLHNWDIKKNVQELEKLYEEAMLKKQ